MAAALSIIDSNDSVRLHIILATVCSSDVLFLPIGSASLPSAIARRRLEFDGEEEEQQLVNYSRRFSARLSMETEGENLSIAS
jgi:hypothetical protein